MTPMELADELNKMPLDQMVYCLAFMASRHSDTYSEAKESWDINHPKPDAQQI